MTLSQYGNDKRLSVQPILYKFRRLKITLKSVTDEGSSKPRNFLNHELYFLWLLCRHGFENAD